MLILLLGLVLFLGAHSVRVFADDWRARVIAARGPGPWKGGYTVVSLLGFALICVGFGRARADTVALWSPPFWTHHVTGLFTLAAFVLVAAAYVPGNAIKARLKDPMILGVKAWALGHLLANGTVADVVLFGSFLAWAVLDFRAVRRRRAAGREPPVGAAASGGRTAIAVVAGAVAWAAFGFWLHARLIGVSPF